MDDFIREELRKIIRGELFDSKNQKSLLNDYLYEASFITYFNHNEFLKSLVKEVAQDAIQTVIVGEVVENMVTKIADE